MQPKAQYPDSGDPRSQQTSSVNPYAVQASQQAQQTALAGAQPATQNQQQSPIESPVQSPMATKNFQATKPAFDQDKLDASAQDNLDSLEVPTYAHDPFAMYTSSPEKSSRKKFFVIGGGVAAMLAVGVFIALRTSSPTDDKAEATSEAAIIKTEESSTQYNNKLVSISLPAKPNAGWASDVYDKNGITRYKHAATGCQVTVQQNRGALESAKKGLKPSDSTKAYLETIRARSENFNKKADSTLTLNQLQDNNKKFTLAAQDVDYKAPDKVAYAVRAGTTWLGDTEIFVVAGCPQKAWSAQQSNVSSFVKTITISVQDSVQAPAATKAQ